MVGLTNAEGFNHASASRGRRLVMTLRCLAFWAALLSGGACGAALEISGVSPPQLWQTAEFRIGGVPASANNFDPEVIRVDGAFTAASGTTITVPAFWYQDYTRALVDGVEMLTPDGAPAWRLRFTPTEPGEYRLVVRVAGPGLPAVPPASSVFTASGPPPSRQHGWVRIAADRRYFETSDGRALRLSGENVCWPGPRGTFDFDAWFPAQEQSGQNFARLWLAPWWAGLEHTPGTLNRYPLEAAWVLDQVFAAAQTHGLYLLLSLDHHGMYMANDAAWGGSNNFWPRNPYARENGGPCGSPNEFFTSAAAQTIYQKRLRYLIARYGQSPHLLAWQFFNEIDNAYIPRSNLVGADVVQWHRVMGRWLHEHDPVGHLVTTSLTGGSDRSDVWTIPELDFTAYHSYFDPAPGRKIALLTEDFIQRYRKPVMIAEFGMSGRDWARPADPHLRGFRQALWAGALGGSVGTSMTWWWEDVHADRAYSLFAALRRILDHAGWSEGTWQPVGLVGPPPPLELDPPQPGATVFNAPLALNSFRRIALPGVAAIDGPLAAARSAEFLTGFLRGSRQPDQPHGLRAHAWFAEGARLAVHVDAIAAAAELVASVDDREVWRERLEGAEPSAPGQPRKVDREFVVPVPAGGHWVEIRNAGMDWIEVDQARLERVQTTRFAGGWRHGAEAVGLRRGERAAVYLTSPWMVYPAGQHRYDGPRVEGEHLTLPDWPSGRFQGEWFDPETGGLVARTEAVATGGSLRLPVPGFSEDLAGVVSRAPAAP